MTIRQTLAVVLIALTVWQALGLRALAAIGDEAPLVIEVTGWQYWWEVVYDPDGRAVPSTLFANGTREGCTDPDLVLERYLAEQ